MLAVSRRDEGAFHFLSGRKKLNNFLCRCILNVKLVAVVASDSSASKQFVLQFWLAFKWHFNFLASEISCKAQLLFMRTQKRRSDTQQQLVAVSDPWIAECSFIRKQQQKMNICNLQQNDGHI